VRTLAADRTASVAPEQEGAGVLRRNLPDLVGAGLAAALVGWSFVAAADDGGHPWRVAALVAAVAGAFIVARLVGTVARWAVPLGVTAAGLWIYLGDPSAVRSDYPLGGFLLYSNARGGFFAMAAGAGVMLAAALWGGRRWLSVGAAVAAVGAAALLAPIPFSTGTHAGMFAVVAFGAVALVAANRGWARGVMAASAVGLVLMLGFTTYLAAGYGDGPPGFVERLVERTPLEDDRIDLWHQALDEMWDHPWTGIGPGNFDAGEGETEPEFYRRNARHGFLQLGAETGIPGMLLLVSLFLWGFWRLWMVADPDRVTALGAVALLGLGVQACLDFILHFPILPIVVAALVGTAVARPRRVDA